MKTKPLISAVSLLFLTVFLSVTALAQKVDLNGVWSCDDGGKYYIRQINNEVWWYGEQSPENPSWSNVAHGKIVGKKLVLDWADVPKGEIHQNGKLVLKINASTELEAESKTGGFGGSAWTKVSSASTE
ncbi:MAG: hypothetical protein HGA87_07550 [Desulfobulbaceae bacterium]|nr:hypothetical protein [Desulfobulbaceae bacterium]